MKAYLATTGILFAVLAVLHVWRAIAEWPGSRVGLSFGLGMAALIAVPGVLALWAWRLLCRLSETQVSHGSGIKEK